MTTIKMGSEKYIQFIASFLIVLILTIPFYVTGTWAAIDAVSVKGSDGIEGFAKSTDSLSFSVQASLDSGPVTKDLLYLGTDKKFDQCTTSTDNITACTLKYPSTGKLSFGSGQVPYTIYLYKNISKQQLVDSKSGSFMIDNLAPQVTLSASKKLYSGQENITINYEADDFACTGQKCAGVCTGIKSIDFYSSDNSFKQTIAPNTTDCVLKSAISIDSNLFKDGANSVKAKATDNLNQISAEKTVGFTIDTTPPDIIAESFAIVRKGVTLSTYGPKSVPVDVFINISADDLDLNSVRADLSSLNPSQNLRNVKASCTKVQNDLSTCKWPIELNPGTKSAKISGAAITSTSNPATGSGGIIINASDLVGNKASAAINKALALDDKGPAVQSLSTDIVVGNIFYARQSGSTITAALTDSTGLSPDDIFLYVGNSRQNPTKCSQESNLVCKWENIDFGNVIKSTLSIKDDTVDILNNPADAKSIDVIVDGISPVVTGISLSPVGSLTDKLPDLFKVGDKIAVEANITEANDVTAVADFSSFIDADLSHVGTCKKLGNDKNQCIWLTDEINFSGTYSIKFNFSDPVNNFVLPEKQLTVLGLEPSAPPDFWKAKVDCSPKTVDRQLGPLINERVYCSVKLEPKTDRKVSTIIVAPAGPNLCKDGSSIAQNIELFNNEIGSTSPIIKFTLKINKFDINAADFNCTFSIISRVDNLITKNPELEDANISIKFYNMPLGELSDVVQNQIDDAKNDIKGLWKLIGTLNKLFETAKKICQLINTLLTIVAGLFLVTKGIHNAEAACEASGIGNVFGVCAAFYGAKSSVCTKTEGASINAETAQAGKTAAEAGKKVTNTDLISKSLAPSAAKTGKGGLSNGFNQFCDFVTCRKTLLWGPKVEKWMNSAPLADFIGKKPDETTGKKQDNEKKQDDSGVQYDPLKGITFGIGNEARPLSTYLDPRNSIFVATMYGCVPGIIGGLEKYRQIKCLYADCLINSVGKDGLPLSVCDAQKSYATCKYFKGELFAVFPYTALYDHFSGLIKDSISNPFTTIGVGASVICTFFCHVPAIGDPSGAGYQICRGTRIFSQVMDSAQNLKSMVDTFQSKFKIQQDYCSRIDLGEDENNSTATA